MTVAPKKVCYCLGFLFDDRGFQVALILKQKPAWQAGKYNGIGGKVEDTESPFDAMVREFREEAGVLVEDWYAFAVMDGSDFSVTCYRAFSSEALAKVRSMEREKVKVFPLPIVGKCMRNLSWLIPLALDRDTPDELCPVIAGVRYG